MKGSPAIYLGRIVDKNHFRAVVYGMNGEKKLVKSWDEFEAAMESGLWFSTLDNAIGCKSFEMDADAEKGDATPIQKPKSKSRGRPKAKPIYQPVQEVGDESMPADGLDDMVYEVTDANR